MKNSHRMLDLERKRCIMLHFRVLRIQLPLCNGATPISYQKKLRKRKLTCSVGIRDIESSLIIIHRFERGTIEGERVGWE
jgi:hypothetical protein